MGNIFKFLETHPITTLLKIKRRLRGQESKNVEFLTVIETYKM
jgi:hypothetical protein